MRARCRRRFTAWRRVFGLMFWLSPTARDRSGRQAPRTCVWFWSATVRTRPTTGLRSTSRPPTYASPRISRWQRAVSKRARAPSPPPARIGREYRQCACRSRDSPAPAGAGDEYPRTCSSDQERPFPVSQRARYGLAGCVTGGDPLLLGLVPSGLLSVAPNGLRGSTMQEH
jgi:hypothetical protein